MDKNINKIKDDKEQQNKYKYVQQVDFYSSHQIKYVKEKNITLYIYTINYRMFIMKLFALNRQQKIIKKIQILAQQMHFMNQSNKVIVSNFGMIQIWRQDNEYNWKKIKTIQRNWKTTIVSLKINYNDDQIVNLMLDGALIFRSQESQWTCQYELKGSFETIKFNKKSNELVAIDDKSIYVFQQTPLKRNKKWTLKDQIQEKYEGICFLEEDNFISWSCQESAIINFQINKSSKLIIINKIQLQILTVSKQLFITYLKQKKIILVQNGNQLIKVKDACDKQYQFEQELLEFINITFNQQEDIFFLHSRRKLVLRKFVSLPD